MPNIVIPQTSEELAEFLADDSRRAELFASGDATKEFLAKYVAAANRTGDVKAIVQEEMRTGLATFLKENGVNRPNLKTTPALAGKGGAYSPRALGAQFDERFETAGDYFQAIWHRARPFENDALKGMSGNVMDPIRNVSSNVPSEGGFLIPEILRSEILKIALENSIVRSRARVIPMDSLVVPFPKIDVTTHSTSIFGGMVAYWTDEGSAATASEATFGQTRLVAKKLTCYTEVPNELLTDSIISFDAFINQLFPLAISWYEDSAFLTGNSTGEPQGVLSSPAYVSVSKETNQANTSIVWENIVKMYSRMLPASLGSAVWVANIDTFPALATMALNVGTGGSAVWLNNGVVGPPMTILGRPVIFTEKVPTLGAVGDLSFIDFGYYLVGDRQAMYSSSSPHFKFQNDVTAYRIIERVDGRGWMDQAITPKSGSSNTLSPFVGLASRP